MNTSPKMKTPSAARRGPSSASLNAGVASLTVKQILEAKNGLKNNSQYSALERIIIPVARSRWMMPDLEWVTPDYISRVLATAPPGTARRKSMNYTTSCAGPGPGWSKTSRN